MGFVSPENLYSTRCTDGGSSKIELVVAARCDDGQHQPGFNFQWCSRAAQGEKELVGATRRATVKRNEVPEHGHRVSWRA